MEEFFAFIGMFVFVLFLLCAMSFVINWIVNTNCKKTIAKKVSRKSRESYGLTKEKAARISLKTREVYLTNARLNVDQEKLKRESVERIKRKETEYQKQRYHQGVSRSTRSSTTSNTSSRSSRSDYYGGSYGSCGGGGYSTSSSSGSDSCGGD